MSCSCCAYAGSIREHILSENTFYQRTHSVHMQALHFSAALQKCFFFFLFFFAYIRALYFSAALQKYFFDNSTLFHFFNFFLCVYTSSAIRGSVAKMFFFRVNFYTKINKFLSRLRELKSLFIHTKNKRYEKHFFSSRQRCKNVFFFSYDWALR